MGDQGECRSRISASSEVVIGILAFGLTWAPYRHYVIGLGDEVQGLSVVTRPSRSMKLLN